MKSILDPSFQYRPSFATDVRETLERIRREKEAVSCAIVARSDARALGAVGRISPRTSTAEQRAIDRRPAKSKLVLTGKAIALLTAIALAAVGFIFAVNQPQPLLLQFEKGTVWKSTREAALTVRLGQLRSVNRPMWGQSRVRGE